jgi:hypothetical protein
MQSGESGECGECGYKLYRFSVRWQVIEAKPFWQNIDSGGCATLL